MTEGIAITDDDKDGDSDDNDEAIAVNDGKDDKFKDNDSGDVSVIVLRSKLLGTSVAKLKGLRLGTAPATGTLLIKK